MTSGDRPSRMLHSPRHKTGTITPLSNLIKRRTTAALTAGPLIPMLSVSLPSSAFIHDDVDICIITWVALLECTRSLALMTSPGQREIRFFFLNLHWTMSCRRRARTLETNESSLLLDRQSIKKDPPFSPLVGSQCTKCI